MRLKGRLKRDEAAIYDYLTRTGLAPHEPGPGRMDALGLIHNQVQSSRSACRKTGGRP